MSGIINPHTLRVAEPAPTAVKKDHDPEETNRETSRLQQIAVQVSTECWAALNPDQDKPAVLELDQEKIIAHFDGIYRKQAEIMNRSGFAHKVNPDLVGNHIREQLRARDLQAAAQKPMHQVKDLTEYKLWHFRDLPMGALHLNSHVAVAVAPEGVVTVWLRGPHETIHEWAEDWATADAYTYRTPQVQAGNYTIAELTMLLSAARVKHMHRVPDQLFVPRAPYTRGNWFTRWLQRA